MQFYNKTLLVCLALLFGLAAAAGPVNISILEMSDLHSFTAGTLHVKDQGNIGQIIQFYELLKEKNGAANTFFLSSGDNHQGTALSDAEEPIPGVTNIELLFNYTDNNFLSAIGNHDLDFKHAEWLYEKSHNESYFADRYLTANVKVKGVTTNKEADYLTGKRFTVREVDGVKIMFFSVLEKTITYLPEWLENRDPVDALDAEFKAFYDAEQPDLIINLIHAGLYTAYESSDHLDWVKGVNTRLREITDDKKVPILHLHGHDHRRYEDTCQDTSGNPVENCIHYDIGANFKQLAVISLSLDRENDTIPYNMTCERTWLYNNVTKLANYFGIDEFPCNENCQNANQKLKEYIEEYKLTDTVAFTYGGYHLPKGDIKWWYENSTYGLFFYKLAKDVFGEQDFYICTGSMMKGGLPDGNVMGNDLYSYAPYDNYMIRVSNVTAKVLYGITHKNADPPSEDPSTWNSIPTESGGVHFVYPFLNTSKIDQKYTINAVSYDLGRLQSACTKFGADCIFEEFKDVSARTLIHKAILKHLPVPEISTKAESVNLWIIVGPIVGVCIIAAACISIIQSKSDKKKAMQV